MRIISEEAFKNYCSSMEVLIEEIYQISGLNFYRIEFCFGKVEEYIIYKKLYKPVSNKEFAKFNNMDDNIKDYTDLMNSMVIAEVENEGNIDYYVCYDDLAIWNYQGGDPNIYVSFYDRNKDDEKGYCLMLVDNYGDRYFKGNFRDVGEVSRWMETPWEL